MYKIDPKRKCLSFTLPLDFIDFGLYNKVECPLTNFEVVNSDQQKKLVRKMQN